MSTTCSDDVSELLLYEFIFTMWIHLHNGSISIHSTWQLLVSIHIHVIFPNVSWSVMVPNPVCRSSRSRDSTCLLCELSADHHNMKVVELYSGGFYFKSIEDRKKTVCELRQHSMI